MTTINGMKKLREHLPAGTLAHNIATRMIQIDEDGGNEAPTGQSYNKLWDAIVDELPRRAPHEEASPLGLYPLRPSRHARIAELEAERDRLQENLTEEIDARAQDKTDTRWWDSRIASLEAENKRLTAMVMSAQHALDEVGAGIARRVLEEREACATWHDEQAIYADGCSESCKLEDRAGWTAAAEAHRYAAATIRARPAP